MLLAIFMGRKDLDHLGTLVNQTAHLLESNVLGHGLSSSIRTVSQELCSTP
jgi:hypothetical protein